jgi:hypothetical protein
VTTAELRALLAQSTTHGWIATHDKPEHDPGGIVWVANDDGTPYCKLADCRPGGVYNARLIAAMHTALPALLDAFDAAQAFYDVAPVMPTARLEARMQDLGTALAKMKTL